MKPAPFLLLAFVCTLHAQFYAPETDYHDISQRTFPVEAARVLAWLRNADGAKIAEVTYKIETTPERETVWTIQWLDAEKKSLREKTVRYPESLLVEGPKYFREVFGQLSGDDWKIEGAPQDDAASAYWQGAESAGAGRLECVKSAGQFLAKNPKVPMADDAARLAGLLAHGALAAVSTQSTLDSVLLSRAAAWTCVAERRGHGESAAHWCPILWLAGREKMAAEL